MIDLGNMNAAEWKRVAEAGGVGSTSAVLERIDETLDLVDALIHSLPLKQERKRQLCSRVYELWSEIEDDMETTPADFD